MFVNQMETKCEFKNYKEDIYKQLKEEMLKKV